VLVGNAGADTIYGMGGDDRLIGGDGIDSLFGGTGKDVFVLQPNGAHYDIINDFVSVDDQVEISASLFGINLLPGFLTGKQAIANTTGLATDGGDDSTRFIYNTATGTLFFDADGTGVGGGARIATFLNNPVVAVEDITIVK
jgi:Ca2+-binding RTX toxin-like protein